jgi:hypothetical protein
MSRLRLRVSLCAWPRSPAAARRLAAVLCLGAGLGGCGSGSSTLPGPAEGTVHAAAASYRGVSLGTKLDDIGARLGPPLGTNNTPFLKPAVQPPFLPSDSPFDKIYPDVRLTLVAARVASISVYGRGARSDSGVGLGDRLGRVRAAFPDAVCVPGRRGLDPEAPGCQIRPAHGVYEYFSGDPVVLIALSGHSIVP